MIIIGNECISNVYTQNVFVVISIDVVYNKLNGISLKYNKLRVCPCRLFVPSASHFQ